MLEYNEILEESKKYYFNFIEKENKNNFPKDIIIMNLYNLVINVLNQQVFDYTYSFKKEDIEFISKYNINMLNIIDKFRKYIT